MTSKAAKKYTQPTHCLLVNEFLSVPSIVQAEQIFAVDKSRVLKFLGHLTPEEMSRVDDAVRASLALNPMGSIQRLEYSFTFNPSLLTIPKRKQQVAKILKEAETYIWRIKEEMRCA